MSNTNSKANGKGRKAQGKSVRGILGARAPFAARPIFALCLLPFALCLAACRQDMQDQPRYEVYEANPFFDDGQASRPLVEGTVPRVARGAQYVDRQTDYFYTGKTDAAGRPMSGADSFVMTGGQAGGLGAATPNTAAGGPAQAAGDVNVRGNAAGGATGGAGGRQSPNAAAGGTGAGGTAGQGGPDIFPFPVTREVLDRGQERFGAFCSMCHGMTGDSDGMIVRRGFQRPPSFHDDAMQEGQKSAAHFFDVITNGFGAMPSYAEMIPPEDRWKIIAYVRALQLTRRGRVEDVPAAERGKLTSAPRQQGGGEPAHGGEQK